MEISSFFREMGASDPDFRIEPSDNPARRMIQLALQSTAGQLDGLTNVDSSHLRIIEAACDAEFAPILAILEQGDAHQKLVRTREALKKRAKNLFRTEEAAAS